MCIIVVFRVIVLGTVLPVEILSFLLEDIIFKLSFLKLKDVFVSSNFSKF